MHLHADRLNLSPSDVTAFLACEHLTTLSLAHARGEIERPEVENEQAELIFRKGLEHERAYLESLRAQGLTVLEIPDPRRRLRGRRARHRRRDPRRRGRRHLPGRPRPRRLARRRRLPDEASRTAPTRRSTPSSRAPRSPPTSSSSSSTTSSSRGSRGASPSTSTSCSATASRRPSDPQRVRRLLPARPLAARALRRRPAADRAVPGRPLLDLRLQARLRRVLGLRRPPLARRRASTGRRSRSSPPPGSRRSRSSGARPPSPCRPGSTRTAGRRTASRPSSSSTRARPARTSYRLLQPQPEAGFALLPDPSPGDLFFDFEGNPFWDASGSLEYLWGILDVDGNFEPLHAHDHETERIAFERFVDLVHERLARYPDLHVYHYAAYEITALKRLMGRYGTRERGARRPAPPRRLRRPLPRRPQRHPRLAAGLRAEGARGLPRLRAAGGGEGRRRLDRHLRAVDADARRRAPAPDRRVQPRGLHRDAAPARLAARAARRGARAVRAVPAARAGRVEADPGGEGRARGAPRAAARRRRGARGAAARLPRPRAQARLVGLLRPDRDDAGGARRGSRSRSAGSSSSASPSRSKKLAGVRAQLPARRSTRSAQGSRRDRPARRAKAPGEIIERRPRGAAARAQARAAARGRAAAGGAHPGQPVPARPSRRTR